MGLSIVSVVIVYLLVVGLGILIAALLMRRIFMIPTIADNLIRQTQILADIAETQKEILKNQKSGSKD